MLIEYDIVHFNFKGFINSEIMKLIKKINDINSNAIPIAFLTVSLTTVYNIDDWFDFNTPWVVVNFSNRLIKNYL